MSQPRKILPLLLPLILAGTWTTGCWRQPAPDNSAEIQHLTSELETTRAKLDAVEKALSTKLEDATVAAAPSEVKATPEPAATSANSEAKLAALQAELSAMKKRDAFVFLEASAALRSGTADIALERYQQFLKNFPNSPLAADADRAITELSATADREMRARVAVTDPRRADRDALQNFRDGTVTLKEIAPLLKGRSQSEIVKLLGAPSQTFRDGKELGYADKIIDTTTGNKGTLVIGFESDSVSTLRIGYLGKPVKP